MLISLFTDASYCSRSRVAAYAAWAKADGRTVRHSGVLKQPVQTSSLAETMALVNGIHLAIAALRPPAASKIIAQTDCLGAIQALSGTLRRAENDPPTRGGGRRLSREGRRRWHRGGIPPCWRP
jgi:ribonuclease HI